MIIPPQNVPFFIVYGITLFCMFRAVASQVRDEKRERLAHRVSRCERRRIVRQQMERRRRAARIR